MSVRLYGTSTSANHITVVNNLSVCLYPAEPNRNPYRNVYGHLAKDSRPLLDTIFFASAMHLSKLGQLQNSEIKRFRLELQASFREALQNDHSPWALGLTVLLSIVFDVGCPLLNDSG